MVSRHGLEARVAERAERIRAILGRAGNTEAGNTEADETEADETEAGKTEKEQA